MPNIYTVSFARSFLDALALKIIESVNGDFLSLCDITVFLPNHRACRSLAEAFLRLSSGKAMLLPKLLSLGDFDEDELLLLSSKEMELSASIDDIEKQLLLALLVKKRFANKGETISYKTALSLAEELANLLNQAETENVDLSKIKEIVTEEFAEHWQKTLEFLSIIIDNWPIILKERGFIEKAARQKKLIDEQIAIWQKTPPKQQVFMAGFSSFQPSVAKLLKAVYELEKGIVVFYGVDNVLDEDAFENLNEAHPQYGIKKLLAHLEVSRHDVRELDFSDKEINSRDFVYSRTVLASEIMRPAETTNNWSSLKIFDETVVSGLDVINFKDQREEALGIALMMREALEAKGTTAALVTPDRNLARRVASELERWHITIDDSSGRPLNKTPAGIFLLLTASMVINGFAPKEFLSAMKHPFACGGLAPSVFRTKVRKLELAIMRGISPLRGINGLKKSLEKIEDKNLQTEFALWLDNIAEKANLLMEMVEKKTVGFGDILKAHMEFAESLAATDCESGALRLWKNDDGSLAADFIARLYDKADILKDINISDYLGILENLMFSQNVRSKYNLHSRLSILGLLEAKLQRFDLVIMGGLNEGNWPREVKADPFINRQMRKQIGLSSPDQNIGFMAYDFCANLCSPKVIITRAEKEGGSPSNCSRWLLKLAAVLKASGLEKLIADNKKWQQYSKLIDKPEFVKAIMPPAPCPPVNARPRFLSVSSVETLMRDPYGVYAKHILKLKALEAVNADVSASEYGSIIHNIFAQFLNTQQSTQDLNLERLLDIGKKYFFDDKISPSVRAFWWPNFISIAKWFIEEETPRVENISKTFCEIAGSVVFSAPFAPFELYARADRIDVLKDGTLEIIDYKTGKPPTKNAINAGYSPQLPLEVAIAKNAGFKGIDSNQVANASFWQLKGRNESKVFESPESVDNANDALDGFKSLIAVFDDEKTPYQSRPNPQQIPKYSDYLHLARVKEWSTASDEEE